MLRADSLEKTLMLEKIEGKRKRGQQKMRLLDSITNSVDMVKKSTFNFSSHSYPVPHSWIKPTKDHLVHVYLKNAHTSGHTEFKLMLIKGQLYTNNPQNSIMRKLQRLERSLHQRKCAWQVGIQKEVQHHFCCCSVTKSCPTLCDRMDCTMPVFPVLHCFLEFAQIHIY